MSNQQQFSKQIGSIDHKGYIKYIERNCPKGQTTVWLTINGSLRYIYKDVYEYECEQCSVEVKTTKDLSINYGFMDMSFCEDCYSSSNIIESDEVDILDDTNEHSLCQGYYLNGKSKWYIMSQKTHDIIGEYETEEAARLEWDKY